MAEQEIRADLLIVEDTLGVSQALQRALSLYRDGAYQVEICETGEAALKWLLEKPFDLLISDLRLPGMDGLELLERARRIQPGIRTLLITAYGTPEIEERSRHLANAYLSKPFRLDELIGVVDRLLAEPPFEAPGVRQVREYRADQKAAREARKELERRKYHRRSAHLIVLAFDLDGTLIENGGVDPETIDRLHQAKLSGLNLILVTGRTLDSLFAELQVHELCEAIIAENGAVVYFPRREAVVLPFGRLDPVILQSLEATGVPLGRGMAIAATSVPYDVVVMETLRKRRSAVMIEYNREALMLLPAGATKGSGLLYALQELGYSPHNVVAFGDAENDLSLLEVAELGVAVANAQPALKSVADTVLSLPDGAGLREFIKDLMDGKILARKVRPGRRLLLGHQLSGAPLYLDPFGLVEGNLGIFGSSGSGKSWLAGLLAEELLKQKYQICVIDPEGEYRGLGASPNTVLIGGPDRPLPPVFDVLNISEWNNISLILDFSMYTTEQRSAYIAEFLRALHGLRGRRGRPHCIFVDEIQSLCPPEAGMLTELFLEAMQQGGFNLISYRISQLAPALLAALDHFLITRLNLAEELNTLRPHIARLAGGRAVLDQFRALPKGQAYLYLNPAKLYTPSAKGWVKFRVGRRSIPHVRHLHKYLRAALPEPKWFYFREGDGRYVGKAAASLWEFREALAQVPLASLRYHLERGDFERWLREVLHDEQLANRIHALEQGNLEGEGLRQALLEVVVSRYEELEALV